MQGTGLRFGESNQTLVELEEMARGQPKCQSCSAGGREQAPRGWAGGERTDAVMGPCLREMRLPREANICFLET